MALKKTTKAPPNDPVPIFNQSIIKMVVLGERPAVAQIADDLALLPPQVDRQVIWLTNGLKSEYKRRLTIPEKYKDAFTTLATVQAFSLSIDNKVCDLILVSDHVDEVRMDQAYTRAGL